MENSKNIFVMPTTDPSQVYLVKSTNAFGFTSGNPEFMEHYGSGTHNQHIYITNKDPYNRGDWVKNVTIEADPPFKFDSQGIIRITQNVPVGYEYEKIILTSNQKLVADGVAEIDFEFLKLLKDKKLDDISNVTVEKTPLLSNNGRALFGYKYTLIILSKENSKQDLEKEMFELEQQLDIPSNLRFHNSKPEYEIIQENAKRILANNIDGLRDALQDDDLFFFYKGVVQCYGEAMAKWQKKHRKKSISVSDLEDGYQQELFNYLHSELDVIALQSQMHDIERIVDSMPSKNIYSEEDMREMYNKSCGLVGLGELNDQTENDNRFRELIAKIKKK